VLQFLLEHGHFLNIDISQGSVATRLRCSGIFKCQFVANLPLSLPVKEFWKSVNIWWSYGQEFSVFFDSRCRWPLTKIFCTVVHTCQVRRSGSQVKRPTLLAMHARHQLRKGTVGWEQWIGLSNRRTYFLRLSSCLCECNWCDLERGLLSITCCLHAGANDVRPA